MSELMVLLEQGTPEHAAWLKDFGCNGTFVQENGKWVGPYVPFEWMIK